MRVKKRTTTNSICVALGFYPNHRAWRVINMPTNGWSISGCRIRYVGKQQRRWEVLISSINADSWDRRRERHHPWERSGCSATSNHTRIMSHLCKSIRASSDHAEPHRWPCRRRTASSFLWAAEAQTPLSWSRYKALGSGNSFELAADFWKQKFPITLCGSPV